MIAITVLAIPMYFSLMAIELIYEYFSKSKTYRINDAITNISTGALQQVSGTFFAVVKVGIYALIYERLAFFQLPNNWWTYIALFILYDLAYYWEHRMAHTISLFWGGHVVHHQSEDFNLSVALRQTSTGFIWGFPFFLPLALMGFDPKVFLVVGGINLLYQFWIHTEHINRLPVWFEFIFNTPSHHRVHHGRDPKYIDKNFAGVFIVWDKMFGTFQQEEERPNYGITVPLKSWNPVYANFAHYIDLAKLVSKSQSIRDSLKILFFRPGWKPSYMGGYAKPHSPDPGYDKYDKNISVKMNAYVLMQFVFLLGVVLLYFAVQSELNLSLKLIYTAWIVWATLIFGFLFELGARKILMLEIPRMLALVFLLWYLSDLGFVSQFIFAAIALVAFLSIAWFGSIAKKYSTPL